MQEMDKCPKCGNSNWVSWGLSYERDKKNQVDRKHGAWYCAQCEWKSEAFEVTKELLNHLRQRHSSYREDMSKKCADDEMVLDVRKDDYSAQRLIIKVDDLERLVRIYQQNGFKEFKLCVP